MSDKLTDSEIRELQDKKQAIKEELYDKVKMEMFEASSALEGYISMPSEAGITPDSWVIVEVNHEDEQFSKILSGWSGGYLDGDSWRLSSPIKHMHIDIDLDYITVDTQSGSQYTLYKSCQGLRTSNAGVWQKLKQRFGDAVEIVEL